MRKPIFNTRRNFVKALLIAPAIPAAISGFVYRNEEMKKQFPHKLKISLNVYSFNNLLRSGKTDLLDLLDFCARYNFDAIDPTGYYFPGYPEPPDKDYINKFKRKAFLLGLDISGTGVRNDFVNPSKEARDSDIRMVKKWIQAAAELGSTNLRIFAGTSKHDGYSRSQVFEWLARDIRECCEYGQKYGVMLALQNHNDFLYTSDDVEKIFGMVNSDWLGLNLDIGSYHQRNAYDEIRKNIGHAVTWQIKENVWIDGKETPADFMRLFKIIKEAGYRGYLPLETLGAGDPYQKVPVLLEHVLNAMQKV